jgi:hypothetical protein
MFVQIEHGSYGCECGCCGYWFHLNTEDKKIRSSEFQFHTSGENGNGNEDAELKAYLLGIANTLYPATLVKFGDLYCHN